jgi:PAS domain-containing protein
MNVAKVTMLLSTFPCVVFARQLKPEVEYAMAYGAEAKICLRVHDDTGRSVSNASVAVSFDMLPNPHSIYGKTDTNGVCVVRGNTNGNKVRFFVGKHGYYGTTKEISYVRMSVEHDVRDGKWLPYGEEVPILLRPVKHPLKLHSVPVREYKFTDAICKWIGYDLEKNDFVKPYGTGKISDFEVYLDWDRVYSIMDCKQIGFKIRFVETWSGYCSVPIEGISEFSTPYNARSDAEFMHDAEFYDRREGQRIRQTFDKSRCWIIRSRCKTDEYGHLVAANYSVARFLGVSGNRELKVGFSFVGAFNPTPNDTNLEDIETAKRSRHFIRHCEPPPQPRKKTSPDAGLKSAKL